MNILRLFPAMHELFANHSEKNEEPASTDDVNLFTFKELSLGPISRSSPGNIPAPRSGHRIFTDDEFLYVIGGFDRTPEDREGKIYREVWRYNLFTQEWTQMDTKGNFPTALASFALAQSAPYSNQVLLFGGTAVPFGATTSSRVHLLSFDSDSNSLVSTILPVEGEKLATYGHAMVRGPDPNTFYVVGGTTGHVFFLDVDKLAFIDGKWRWSSEAQTSPNEEGRYRLETVLHEDLIYFFGGGRPDFVTELQHLTVFNTKTKTFMEISTIPDENWIRPDEEEDGFPKGRRCHSVTKWKRKAILVGGCSADKDDDDVRHVDMFDDVWSFDLDTHQWKRLPFDLAAPVFFHDATITREGCLIVWGGVLDIYSSVRTNTGQYCYLAPPSLKTLAASALRPFLSYKTIEDSNNLRFSRLMDVVREFMALSLLSQNRCSFGGCHLCFASVDDLIAHIEFVHITPLEEEYRQKVSQAQYGSEENRASATPNMPLSCVYRLFRLPHNPQPCAPDVVRLNFNHYRKRSHEANAPSSIPNVSSSSSIKKEDSSSSNSNGEDLSECGPNESEDRFRCTVAECGKRFKCNAGLRLHSRTTHGVVLQENIPNAHSVLNGSGSSSSSHNGHPPPTVSPTKYAASRPYKCGQCSKRYKTTAGLSNHVEQSHKKQSGGRGTPSSTDSAPASPSPAVLDQLISQARAHGQATQEQQRAMTRPLPVQVASATSASSHQYGQMQPQAPLPVRSLSSTHTRYSQNQGTGQQGASQVLHQSHIPQRRAQFGAIQAQLVSSSSPQHVLQSGVDGTRTVSSDSNEDNSRRFHTPHVAESGPILLTPKQS